MIGKKSTSKVEYPKIPTLLQYAKQIDENPKTSREIVFKQRYIIDVIWYNPSFKTVTLQTHAFRILVNHLHPDYEEWTNYLAQMTEDSPKLGLKIVDVDSLDFEIVDATSKKPQHSWKVINGGIKLVESK